MVMRRLCEVAREEGKTPSSFCRELLSLAFKLEYGDENGGDLFGLSMDNFVRILVDLAEDSEDPIITYKNVLSCVEMAFKTAYHARTGENLPI